MYLMNRSRSALTDPEIPGPVYTNSPIQYGVGRISRPENRINMSPLPSWSSGELLLSMRLGPCNGCLALAVMLFTVPAPQPPCRNSSMS